jgi:hypothetical protein
VIRVYDEAANVIETHEHAGEFKEWRVRLTSILAAFADDLVDAGVRIIFNYSEGLLDVPSDVTVHTSNPAVELLHALYFHLA